MNKKNKDYNIPLRLLRPLLHIILIVLWFFFIYKLRLITDLIPGIQLPIPAINYKETMLFAFISGFVFTWIWIIKNLYELNKPIQKYFQTYTKVRIYRFITITFIWYFGTGFIFGYWISRFIILLAVFDQRRIWQRMI